MGQSPSSVRSKSGRQRSFRGFHRRNKMNKSNLSHTFSLPPSEEYPELMNINTATEEQLMTLPGVNRQLARAIVVHRQIIGRFKRVDDLALVSGIGAEKLESLRPEICTNQRKSVSRASSCTQSLDSMRLSIESKLCSINSSSVFQLQCVPGLNQEIAANIVDYRNKKGPFKSLDDLIKVRGMDIVRLSTVKHHLCLELRKCESVQQLTNGYANGWISQDDSISNGVTSTPRTPHRKSFSVPIRFPMTLPNGFATAPVNDILDLLSAYSHRPIVAENFMYERDGVRCCRIASWNLQQLSVDKIMNPGVREVVCRTILENKLSLVALQDITEQGALKILCEELNSPTLRRVREWKCNSHNWEYCISEHHEGQKLGFIYDSVTRGISIESLDLEQMCLVTDAVGVKRIIEQVSSLGSERYAIAARGFLLCGRPLILINVYCKSRLSFEDITRLSDVAQLAVDSRVQFAYLGEFHCWDNVQLPLECKSLSKLALAWTWKVVSGHTSFHSHLGSPSGNSNHNSFALNTCESILDEETTTRVDGSTTDTSMSSILCPGTIDKSRFNGHGGVIKSGLSHLAIPRGWSWGGPASSHCPVWAEIKIPD